ncbi:hypothetical protein FQZ97_1045850 [compost metagenome]
MAIGVFLGGEGGFDLVAVTDAERLGHLHGGGPLLFSLTRRTGLAGRWTALQQKVRGVFCTNPTRSWSDPQGCPRAPLAGGWQTVARMKSGSGGRSFPGFHPGYRLSRMNSLPQRGLAVGAISIAIAAPNKKKGPDRAARHGRARSGAKGCQCMAARQSRGLSSRSLLGGMPKCSR